MNIVEKIINGHIAGGKFEKGKESSIQIDQTLTQDATGTMAYLELEAIGVEKVKTELSVSYVDHNTLQMGFENADDHEYLRTVAKKYGIFFSKAGNGICHQVHLERFGKPGKTLLGSDSHTPTNGGIGMLAIGAGGLDVALAMAGRPFYTSINKITKIELIGKLRPFVSAKDIILKVLEILTTKGNVGTVLEYGGEGIKHLSVPERATITNMGAELGVTTSIFPSDEVTREFLKKQGREKDFVELKADPGSEYDEFIKIDLGMLVPLVAKPHSPGNIAKVSEVSGTKVNQVCIGSCTNSSYSDLSILGKMLEGKKVKDDVELIIAPGSKQVLNMIAKDKTLSRLISAGARIAESACGFCIGAGHSPNTDAVSVRTNNRNFEGRSGTASAKIYLASVETAAACALTGEITDPTTLGLEPIKVDQPEFLLDDSMILKDFDPKTTITRGPNIGSPPEKNPVRDNIEGIALLKVGDKVTTDHIMPAGARLKYRSNIPKYSEFVFEIVDKNFSKKCLENKKKGIANILIAGESYGQGSSREHAAICPAYLGVKAVIAKSIERIHKANLINFGILPLQFENHKDYESIQQDDEIVIEDIIKCLQDNKTLIIKGKNIKLRYDLTENDKNILIKGGKLYA
ncbi:MAG: aconitate hydratase [Nanoarchaeota archaeon]|nr:aconitate hydratase [Nanoarchaeota archaeon]MBU1704556.1 aconitate hydratase [Nanoarchaeota archaeon]